MPGSIINAGIKISSGVDMTDKTDISENFKPCMCGGDELDIIVRLIYRAMRGDAYIIECSNCGASKLFMNRSPHSLHHKAADTWNNA
jgi:hypothetical protein